MHAGNVDEIGHHRARRRLGARARAIIERRAHRVAFDQDGIHHAFDVGDQSPHRDERGMDTQLDALARALGDAEELDAVAELLRVTDVLAA